MKWETSAREAYQQAFDGRAHDSYYIYKVSAGVWRAGRFTFNRDVDFRIDFSSAKVARDYIEVYDREAVLITAM
jgi:hypothetical protein